MKSSTASSPGKWDSSPATRPYGLGVVRSLVRRRFARPAGEYVARIAAADVTVLSELVGGMYTMHTAIHALAAPALRVTGVVSTAKCPPGDNLGLVKALTLVQAGDVLVVDAQGFAHWCLGGFKLLQHARETRGLAGHIAPACRGGCAAAGRRGPAAVRMGRYGRVR